LAHSVLETVAKVADWILQENINEAQYDLLNQSLLGTGLWLLKSKEYQKWVSGHDQTVFWQAIPGVGKTILSAILAEELRRKFSENSVGVAALFCDYRKRDEQGLLYFLSSILKQLVQYRRHLPEAVKVLYEFHSTRKTRLGYDDLSNALQSMIEDSSKTFIIIDGLDECVRSDGTLQSLLFEISRLQKQGHVCLFATSRPIPDIAKEFQTAIKLDARATDEDLRAYINSYRPRFQSFLENDPDLQNKIKDEVIEAANGM
jgi:Cdc6-like AAA superfamily ATPase